MAYNPLRYYLFDDQQNRRRDSLTQITGFVTNIERLVGMEFIHTTGGQQQTFSHLIGSRDGERIDFAINGPHGEHINEVRVAPPPMIELGTRITVRLFYFLVKPLMQSTHRVLFLL
jgi:hypothetical protein